MVAFALAVVHGAALRWRRSRPELVTAVTIAAGIPYQIIVPEIGVPFAASVALWSLTLHRPPRISLIGLAGVLALSALSFFTAPFDDALFAMVVAISVWALAEAARNRRAAIQEATRRAVADEQGRIARELHDVIAHSVAVIVVQAAAAGDVFDSRPDQARAALRSIEDEHAFAVEPDGDDTLLVRGASTALVGAIAAEHRVRARRAATAHPLTRGRLPRHHDVPQESAMNELLRAELIKLRTTRTFVAIAAVAIGTSVLIAALVALLTEPTEDSVLYDVFASDTSSFFILLLAVIGISGEWRHRTITSSLLAAPDRRGFLAAKAIAFATAGIVLSLLIAVTGVAILSTRDLPLPEIGELAGLAGRNALLADMLGAFGVAIGGIVRNQIVAVVSLLVVMFVVEPVILTLAPGVGRYGPFGALSVAAAGIPAEDAGLGDVRLVGTGTAVLLLLTWIAVAFVTASTLLQRRDLE